MSVVPPLRLQIVTYLFQICNLLLLYWLTVSFPDPMIAFLNLRFRIQLTPNVISSVAGTANQMYFSLCVSAESTE